MNATKNGGRPRIAIGADHHGQSLKDKLIGHLREERHTVKDCGGHNAEPVGGVEVVDVVAQSMASGEADVGIVISGSGAVASIVANKIPGVRACYCQDAYSARQARRIAASDILCLGARVLGDELAAEIARAFVGEQSSEDARHELLRSRIQKMEEAFDVRRAELQRAHAADPAD
jgi:ribose 5-phosphate isomerase B